MEVLVGANFGIPATAQDSRARLFDGAIAKDSSPDDSPETSSSIGAPDDSDEEEEDDDNEAQSKFRGGSLACLDSLDDALPVKRGLSNHFSGKSKSFASLADVVTVRDLKKTENPLNKRRRLVIASKWSKKAFYSWSNPKSMPLLALNEDEEDESKDEVQDGGDDRVSRLSRFQERRMTSFRTRCFSLADLQEHSLLEEEDEDEDDDDDDHH